LTLCQSCAILTRIKGVKIIRDVKEPEVRQAEIMQAALSLFVEKGYTNTTTQDIIDRVKISRGLLYYHFKNKEDILFRMIERYTEPKIRRLSEVAYDQDKTAIEKMKLFIESTLISPDDITTETITLQNTVNLEQNQYMVDQFSHNCLGKIIPLFSHIIKQGISENAFDVEYPEETAAFLMTGYLFVSDEIKAFYTDVERLNRHLSAFKKLLIRTIGIEEFFIFDD